MLLSGKLCKFCIISTNIWNIFITLKIPGFPFFLSIFLTTPSPWQPIFSVSVTIDFCLQECHVNGSIHAYGIFWRAELLKFDEIPCFWFIDNDFGIMSKKCLPNR
jgi:hypothetical protein